MENIPSEQRLIERLYWFIKLRWAAIAGVIFTVFLTEKILHIPLAGTPLYTIAVIISAYNLIFLFYLNRIRKTKSAEFLSVTVNRAANLQISFDLPALAALIHFSGGIENPFIFYFIFHPIIAGFLLSRRASFLQASFAAALFFLTVSLEYFSVIPHYCLSGFILHDQHSNLMYIGGVLFAFASTLYIATYMAGSISKRLRQQEKILKETNVLLQERDRIKSEYVLQVSHDIKEHLAAIQGCLEPVAEKITGELNLKQSDLIQRATKRTVKLMFFVRALLEITRIKLNRKIKMEQFSFKEVLSESILSITPKANGKNISLNSVVAPSIDKICGVKEYILGTLVNLLANSVKYTQCNGRIDVQADDKGNRILIKISDNGIGIPKDELPRIFDEFFRASNAKAVERDGTGLGLSIAKQVIEIHNGNIRAESEDKKGSIFYIELPKNLS